MDGEEAECPSEVHLAQRLASLMHRAFICSLVCAAHLAVIPVSSDGTTLAVEYYKACAEQEFDSHQNKSLSALRRSDVLVCVCFSVRVSADWRLGQADRSMRLRHLNSWSCVQQFLFSSGSSAPDAFPFSPIDAVWESGFLISAAQQRSLFMTSHPSTRPARSITFTWAFLSFSPFPLTQDLSLLFVACLLIILPKRSLRNQLN